MTTAKALDYPDRIWLGKVDGEWPILAFVNERAAASWAAENAHRSVVGPIVISIGVRARRAEIVPAMAAWKVEDVVPQEVPA